MSGIDCLHLPKLPRYPTNHRSDYETTLAILSPPMFLNFSFRYWSCRSIWTLWSHPSHHHLKLTFSGAWHMCQSEKVFQAKLQRHWHLMLVLHERNQKFLTRVYLNRENATFHLRPCWTLFHIWSQRKKPTVFGAAGWLMWNYLWLIVISGRKTLKLKTVSWIVRMENAPLLFLLWTCWKTWKSCKNGAFLYCHPHHKRCCCSVQSSGSYIAAFAGSFRWFYFGDKRFKSRLFSPFASLMSKYWLLEKLVKLIFCLRYFEIECSDLTSFSSAKIKICEKGLLMPIYGHLSQLRSHWLVCR